MVTLGEFNLDHGGLVHGTWGTNHDYDFTGLVEAFVEQWPDLIVLCEGAYYEYQGNAGSFGAAKAMNEASGRRYVPLPGTLTGNRGPLAPVVYFDAQKIEVHRWYSGREPDHFPWRTNLLCASRRGSRQTWLLVAVHLDVDDGDRRLQDVKLLRRWADPGSFPLVILGDFNSHPSGPHWAVDNFTDAAPHRRLSKTVAPPDLDDNGHERHECDTRALDYLLGRWYSGQRWGGAGFYDAAELARDYTPTVNPSPRPGGFGPMTLDRAVFTRPFKDAFASYQVHLPRDSTSPPSSHRPITVEFDI